MAYLSSIFRNIFWGIIDECLLFAVYFTRLLDYYFDFLCGRYANLTEIDNSTIIYLHVSPPHLLSISHPSLSSNPYIYT